MDSDSPSAGPRQAWGTVKQRFADPDPLPGTRLHAEQTLPGVRFEDPATGGPARPGDLRHRRALVLAFVHDDCDECARWAAHVSARLATRPDADVRIVAPDRGPGGERALPLWTDPHGSRARLLTDPGAPAVLLLDRFSALREAWVVEDNALPGSDRIAAELAYLAVECPECSV